MTKEEIKEARLQLGMTQVEFAAAIGVKGNSVARWESGLHTPHPVMVRQIRGLMIRDRMMSGKPKAKP